MNNEQLAKSLGIMAMTAKLKAGGPVMKIKTVEDTGDGNIRLGCEWNDPEYGHLCYTLYPLADVELRNVSGAVVNLAKDMKDIRGVIK